MTAAGAEWHPDGMEQRVSLVTFGVADLARARAFYEALGWHGAQQPDDEICFFQAGGADPDGYVWEVAHNPGWTLEGDGSLRI